MSILVFDTETSGLIAGQICQLSYITEEEGVVTAKNFFFAVDYVSPAATEVNSLTVEILEQLSGGRVFSDDAEEIAADFAAHNLIVSHNFSFDYMFLNTELKRTGRQLVYHQDFCTMRRFTPVCGLIRPSSGKFKYPKLSELMAYLNVNDVETKDLAKTLFGTDSGYHDARFDTAALYMCVKKGCHYFPNLKEALGTA